MNQRSGPQNGHSDVAIRSDESREDVTEVLHFAANRSDNHLVTQAGSPVFPTFPDRRSISCDMSCAEVDDVTTGTIRSQRADKNESQPAQPSGTFLPGSMRVT